MSLLDFYFKNMSKYYNINNFLLLYESIPITFSELGNQSIPIEDVAEVFDSLFHNNIEKDLDLSIEFLNYAIKEMEQE